MGLPSTVVGDHTGIVGAVCFFYALEKTIQIYFCIRYENRKEKEILGLKHKSFRFKKNM